MELLAGRTLFRAMADGPMPVQAALDVIDQVLDSLDEAHRAGILHLDIKPENIFLVPSRRGGEFVKVIDFGIARFSGPRAEAATVAGGAVGTPRYMSPEAVEGRTADVRSDLYSVGVLLYELLTGEAPIDAPDPFTLALRKLREKPRSLHDAKPDLRIPPEFALLLDRMLARDPDDRPASVDEFRNLLLIAMDGFRAELPAALDPERGTAKGADRRRFERERRALSVAFVWAGRWHRATITDVSGGGAFLHAACLPPLGSRLAILLCGGVRRQSRHILVSQVVRIVERASGPGDVRGFGVRWMLPSGLPTPQRFGDLLVPETAARPTLVQ
jgi:hypothetical protein